MQKIGESMPIEINNQYEMRYFQQYYLQEKITKANLRNPVFMLLDRQGNVLFVNSHTGFKIEEVVAALAGYE